MRPEITEPSTAASPERSVLGRTRSICPSCGALEPLDDQAARLARRLEDRLRAGRLLERCRGSEWCPVGFEEALAAVRVARRAIEEGRLGYAILAATAR
jgi:hypothetical protein